MRDFVEFLPFVALVKAHWPRCVIWHGWLPALGSGVLSSQLEKAFGAGRRPNMSGLWIYAGVLLQGVTTGILR